MCVMNVKIAGCSVILQVYQLIGLVGKKCELITKINFKNLERVVPLNKVAKIENADAILCFTSLHYPKQLGLYIEDKLQLRYFSFADRFYKKL